MEGRYEHNQQRYSAEYETIGESNEQGRRLLTSTITRANYGSAIAPRYHNILGYRGSMLRSSDIYRTTGIGALQSNVFAMVSSNTSNAPVAVSAINLSRLRDKRDLVSLNDKFAQYIEKLRFLEVQNRKLNQELQALQHRSNQGSSHIRDMYDIEIGEARKLIDSTKREADDVRDRRRQKERDLQDLQARHRELAGHQQVDQQEIDRLQRKIDDNEAQIGIFRRRLVDIEDESRIYKNASQRLATDLARLQSEIQHESLLRSSCDVDKMTAEEELARLKQLHAAELIEIRGQHVSSDLDPSLFFRNELASAIQEIRNDYESTVENHRQNLHVQYSLLVQQYAKYTTSTSASPIIDIQTVQGKKIQEEFLAVKNRNAYLRAENRTFEKDIKDITEQLREIEDQDRVAREQSERDLADLRRRLDNVEGDYNNVTTLQTTLQREIGQYRELLEGQNGLSGYISRIEQLAIDRAGSSNNALRYGGTSTGGTISRTYINRSSSNYYVRPTPSISSLVNRSNASSSTYQTFSASPRRPETSSGNYASRDETSTNYQTRNATSSAYQTRDDSSNNYQPRDSQFSSYQFRDNQSRGNESRDNQNSSSYRASAGQSSDYASREAVLAETPVTIRSAVTRELSGSRTSLSRDSSLGSRTSLVRESRSGDNRRSMDYDT